MATQEKSFKIALQGYLSVHNAAAIRNEMLAALSKSEHITIDFSALEDFDVSILQLLFALVTEAHLTKKEVCFVGIFAPAVKKCFAVSGFIVDENTADEQIYTEFVQKTGKKT